MSDDQGRLMVGFAASLLINALIVIPIMTGESEADLIRLDSTKTPIFEPDLPDPDDVKLGIEESEASTLTWIGYKEYREHMAKLADLEQAQFTVGGGAQGGGGNPQPVSQPSPEQVAEQPTPEQPETTPKPQPEAAPPQPPLPEVPDPTLPKVSQTDAEQEADEPSETKSEEPPHEQPVAEPSPPTPPKTQPQPNPAQPQSGDAAPTPGQPDRSVGPASPGADDLPPVPNPTDRESDAAAKVPVNIKRPGGPVAAQGLEVRTRRPKLTPFQEMQFGRIAIVARIEFERSGKPRRISLGRQHPKTKKMIWTSATKATGFESVVVNALFQWRASGKQLQELSEDQTIPIVFELTYR